MSYFLNSLKQFAVQRDLAKEGNNMIKRIAKATIQYLVSIKVCYRINRIFFELMRLRFAFNSIFLKNYKYIYVFILHFGLPHCMPLHFEIFLYNIIRFARLCSAASLS